MPSCLRFLWSVQTPYIGRISSWKQGHSPCTLRVFRTGEVPSLKIMTRNLEKLTFTAYKLNPETDFRKKHGLENVESLDIGLVAPDAEWTVDVPGYARYKPIEVSYELKKLEQPGVYVVKVTDQEHLQATTLALTSDIEAIVRTSCEYMLIFRPGYEDRQGNAPGDRAGLRAVGVQPPVANPAGGQDLLAKPGNNLKQIHLSDRGARAMN